MNNVLQLKGRFEQRPNSSKPGSPKLPKGKSVSSLHLVELSEQLKEFYSIGKPIQILGVLWLVYTIHILSQRVIE